MTNGKSMKHTHYWFEPEDGKIGPDDEREPVIGRMHLPRRDRDAAGEVLISYASPAGALRGKVKPTLWGVIPSGEIRTMTGDFSVGMTERTYVWSLDVTQVLDEHARSCLKDVSHLWNIPPDVEKYLESGNDVDKALAREKLSETQDFEKEEASSYIAIAVRDYVIADGPIMKWLPIEWYIMMACFWAGEESLFERHQERLERAVLAELWRINLV